MPGKRKTSPRRVKRKTSPRRVKRKTSPRRRLNPPSKLDDQFKTMEDQIKEMERNSGNLTGRQKDLYDIQILKAKTSLMEAKALLARAGYGR